MHPQAQSVFEIQWWTKLMGIYGLGVKADTNQIMTQIYTKLFTLDT